MSRLHARLQRAGLEAAQAGLVERALREGGERVSAARSVPLDHRRARAIPIIGPMAGGGAIPGTRPDRNRRLDSWSGRG